MLRTILRAVYWGLCLAGLLFIVQLFGELSPEPLTPPITSPAPQVSEQPTPPAQPEKSATHEQPATQPTAPAPAISKTQPTAPQPPTTPPPIVPSAPGIPQLSPEVEQFIDELDNRTPAPITPANPNTTSTPTPSKPHDETSPAITGTVTIPTTPRPPTSPPTPKKEAIVTRTTMARKWDPPPLADNRTIIDLNETDDQDWWQFKKDEDVLFIASRETRTASRLQTEGGRNIVIIGGDFRPKKSATATIYFTKLYGAAYIEGVHIDNRDAGAMDAIAVYGAEGRQPDITIQNSRIENVSGSRDGVHGDVFQTHGPVGDIRMYNLTASTSYQGLFIAPQAATRSAHLERVQLSYTGGGDTFTYLYWFLDSDEQTPYPITLIDVYTDEKADQRAEDLAVWPKSTLGNIGAVRDGDHILWPRLPYKGHITVGRPSGDDFVMAADVGLAYVTPTIAQH